MRGDGADPINDFSRDTLPPSSSTLTASGNGPALRSALSDGQSALEVIDDRRDALTRVSTDLADLVDVLAKRDRRIRTFTHQAGATLDVLDGQRSQLVATMRALDTLTRLGSRFLRRNAGVLGSDLAGMQDIVHLVRQHQSSLAEAFDVMPLGAQNYARAYDWKTQRLRVQFAFSAGQFSSLFRAHSCALFAAALPGGSGLCDALFTTDGTGFLDGLLDGLYDAIPGGIP